MKFGGLSEKELVMISEILQSEGIDFQVGKDIEIEKFNQASMKNNLRHYTPPNISTHILSIEIDDSDFTSLSESARVKLLDFGITDEAPADEDFTPISGEPSVHQELLKGPIRVVAFNFKHQLILAAVFLAIWLLLKSF